MNPVLQRALLIAGIIAVSLGFFVTIWLVFFRPTDLVPTGNAPGNVNGLPTTGNRNVNGVVNGDINGLPFINGLPTTAEPSRVANGGATLTEEVVGSSSSRLTLATVSNSFRYYDRERGQFFELTADGTGRSLLSDAVYRDVSRIDWSSDGSKAILSFPDNSKVLYDFTLKKQTTLPSELNEFSFSPTGDQVASKYLNPNNRQDQWLMVSRPDGSESDAAEHLGANADGVTTAWSPNNQIIGMYEKSVDSELSEIIFLGANGENFQSAQIEGRGFEPIWSPDGQRLLYSAYGPNTNDNPHLYIMNASPDQIGGQLIDLGLTTRADKCTFSLSGLSIYCAVPYYMNPGSGPQPELSSGIPDNIYRIDLLTGSSSLIARPVDGNLNQRFSATSLQVSPNEDSLVFIDSATGRVHKIRLR